MEERPDAKDWQISAVWQAFFRLARKIIGTREDHLQGAEETFTALEREMERGMPILADYLRRE